ncbi:methyltransferase [Dethiosulfatarculus sandiegensis]|nr:methyltransferase [Dethiosulfatarculus sandiegensis]
MPIPLPKPECAKDSLYHMQNGEMIWEILETSLKLKLFDHTQLSVSPENLASALKAHPKNLGFFMDALASLDFLEKKDGQYLNSPLARSFLVSTSPTYQGNVLLTMHAKQKQLLNGGLRKLVLEGPQKVRQDPEKRADPQKWGNMARLLAQIQASGQAQTVVEFVKTLPEAEKLNKMLDVGAGPGLLGIALAQALPGLECLLFDQAPVVPFAEKSISQYQMQDRVQTMAGDYSQDPIGEGYDLILASLTLEFFKDRLAEVLTRFKTALNSQGLMLIITGTLTQEKTKPTEQLLSWLPGVLNNEQMMFEPGQIEQTLQQVGFVSLETRPLPGFISPHGPLTAFVGRKP